MDIARKDASDRAVEHKDLLASLTDFSRSFGGVLTEFLLLYGAVIALFLSVTEFQYQFLEMHLHPLFIISCFLGIRHGFITGLISSALSGLIYFFSYSYLDLDPILFFNSYEYYKFPLIFLLGGYLAGRVHDSNQRKYHEMQEANQQVLSEYDQLEKSYKRTVQMYNELKEQVVGAEYSIFSLYDIAVSLQTTNPEKVYTESIGLLYKFIKARGVSIYMLESSGYLRTKIHFGTSTRKSGSRRIDDHPMYEKAIRERRAVKWTPDSGNSAPVFTAPIVTDDRVIGLIDIDAIDFKYVTEYSFSVFQIISEWITKALSQALEIDRQFNLMGVDYSNMLEIPQFLSQKEEEQIRMDKYGLPYCSEVYDIGDLDPDDIVPVLQHSLRNVDYIAYDRFSNQVSILLPATDRENYAAVEDRLFSTIGRQLKKAV